jgi:hypothetical protein
MGLRDARRWPLLPLGIMTAGHPVPNRENEIPSLEQCSVDWFLKWPTREWAIDGAMAEKRVASYLKMLAENGALNSADPSWTPDPTFGKAFNHVGAQSSFAAIDLAAVIQLVKQRLVR